jgi:hypothetical protein
MAQAAGKRIFVASTEMLEAEGTSREYVHDVGTFTSEAF